MKKLEGQSLFVAAEMTSQLFDFNSLFLHFPHDLVCVILKPTGHNEACDFVCLI